jgi:membrane protein implicated in regulation of membrane protease activity
MNTYYWFALIVGAGLLLFSLLGDADSGDGADGAGDGHDADPHGMRILSMRTATYFLFAFGATGVLAGLTRADALATAIVSLGGGLLSGGLSAVAFRWLKQSQSGALEADDSLVGRVGRVILPLSENGTGKIEIQRSGREIELLARPFDKQPRTPEAWTTVVIIDVEGGTALVSPYNESLGAGDDVPRLPNPAED